MDIAPRLFTGHVMHARHFPRKNAFRYGIFYLDMSLENPAAINDGWRLGYDKAALLSIQSRQHGAHDGTSLHGWMEELLRVHGAGEVVRRIRLVTMPALLGYAFNPVSFFLCEDAAGQLRAVLAEVHNTFGETHSYFCAHADFAPLAATDWLESDKQFHVSPFLPREGGYRFRFDSTPQKLGVWIDYYTADGRLQLSTSLIGRLQPLTRASLRRAFWRHPLVTLRALWLIHWQALRLVSRRARYIAKPAPLETRLTRNRPHV